MSDKKIKKNKPAPVTKQKQRVAKYAMTGTMAMLVYTGLKKGKTAKKLHIVSGVALMALSFYHTSLYPYKSRS